MNLNTARQIMRGLVVAKSRSERIIVNGSNRLGQLRQLKLELALIQEQVQELLEAEAVDNSLEMLLGGSFYDG